MLEKPLLKFENIGKEYLKIDTESLESQLEKASSLLEKISENNNFSTFSHFGKLLEFVNNLGGNPNRARELLEKWDYSCFDYIEKENCGNCVDFAVLGQKILLDSGIPTTIIGKHPDVKEFNKKQIDFMKYRHTSLLYANEEKDKSLKLFMFEPGWKFNSPIAVDLGTISGNKDWQFETIKVGHTGFTQKTYHVSNQKYGEREFDVFPLDIPFCKELTKNLIRIPRNLEIINKLKEGTPTKFVKFNPNKKTFSSNIDGIGKEFLPNLLNVEQKKLLENALEQPGLVEYLSNIFELHKSLPDDFWIIN